MLELSPSAAILPEEELLEMMFQHEYKDLFQSSLSQISIKEDTLHENLMQLTRTISEQTINERQEDKPTQRFMRILDILNQSDPSFRERQGSKEKKGNTHSQRVKGRKMIILPKKDIPK